MEDYDKTVRYICEIAKVPSFSSYEERLHPWVNGKLNRIEGARQIECKGNNLI